MLPFGVKKRPALAFACRSVCDRNKKCRGWALKQVSTIRCKKHIFLDPQIVEIGREMFCVYDINCDPITIFNQDSLDACGLLENVLLYNTFRLLDLKCINWLEAEECWQSTAVGLILTKLKHGGENAMGSVVSSHPSHCVILKKTACVPPITLQTKTFSSSGRQRFGYLRLFGCGDHYASNNVCGNELAM